MFVIKESETGWSPTLWQALEASVIISPVGKLHHRMASVDNENNQRESVLLLAVPLHKKRRRPEARDISLASLF